MVSKYFLPLKQPARGPARGVPPQTAGVVTSGPLASSTCVLWGPWLCFCVSAELSRWRQGWARGKANPWLASVQQEEEPPRALGGRSWTAASGSLQKGPGGFEVPFEVSAPPAFWCHGRPLSAVHSLASRSAFLSSRGWEFLFGGGGSMLWEPILPLSWSAARAEALAPLCLALGTGAMRGGAGWHWGRAGRTEASGPD